MVPKITLQNVQHAWVHIRIVRMLYLADTMTVIPLTSHASIILHMRLQLLHISYAWVYWSTLTQQQWYTHPSHVKSSARIFDMRSRYCSIHVAQDLTRFASSIKMLSFLLIDPYAFTIERVKCYQCQLSKVKPISIIKIQTFYIYTHITHYNLRPPRSIRIPFFINILLQPLLRQPQISQKQNLNLFKLKPKSINTLRFKRRNW